MSPNGLVLSLLIFGTLRTFRMDNRTTNDQQIKMKMKEAARKAFFRIIREQLITIARRSDSPSFVKYVINPEDQALAYRKNEQKWIFNPHIVHIYGKNLCASTGQRVVKLKIT